MFNRYSDTPYSFRLGKTLFYLFMILLLSLYTTKVAIVIVTAESADDMTCSEIIWRIEEIVIDRRSNKIDTEISAFVVDFYMAVWVYKDCP